MILVLGSFVVFVKVWFVFDVMVVKFYELGDVVGQGVVFKMINQLFVGVYIVVVLEVMVFVVK